MQNPRLPRYPRRRGPSLRTYGRGLVVGLVLVILVLAATCVGAPVAWYLREPVPWRVAVIDKTVPHTDYREHRALYWVLRHDKASSIDGGRDWDPAEHYVGFHPDGTGEEPYGRGDTLRPADLQGADLAVIADSYGVYRGDYEEGRGRAALDFSPRIYGGLSRQEVAAVEDFVGAGGHLLAEFNVLASPTTGAARRALEGLLGVDWSGWSGRRFTDLGDLDELPRWAPRLWREQTGEEWEFDGPGFLLVHEDTRLVVLRQEEEVEPYGLRIRIPGVEETTPGRLGEVGARLVSDLVDDVSFGYWFDIVRPRPGSRELARFELRATSRGRVMLRDFGIPSDFPAVVLAGTGPLSLYLAGDFSDAGHGLGPHWIAGLPALNRFMVRTGLPAGFREQPFYWGIYVPLLRNLLTLEP